MSSDDNAEILYNIAKIWVNNNNFNPTTIIPFATTLIRSTQKLVSEKELVAFKHEGFWQCMDTMREKNYLNKLIYQGKAPWLK